MSVLISVAQLRKAFGARNLFEGLSFSINEGERIGLIGPNGVGKSTLLKVLAGRESPDGGQVVRNRGLKMGYLEQEPQFDPTRETVQELLDHGLAADDWEAHQAIPETLSRFGLDPQARVADLSGGWKKRLALAREILKKPDLLLLDEPTNHLDLEGIHWLEDYLGEARFASLTVTHDRLFLDRVSNRILEIHPRNPGGILSVDGNYADFLAVQESLVAEQKSREASLRNTLRRETEWLRRGAKARTTKQQARIQRADVLKDTVQDLAGRNKESGVRLGFVGTADNNPKKLIDAKGIRKAYDGRTVVPTVDVRLTPQTRLGLLGRNGSGKSTLIRLLLGREAPDTGAVTHSEKLEVAYFEQDRGSLDPDVTLLRTLCPTGETVEYRGTRIHIRSYLGRFLFTQQQMDMPVGKLSGGEQARLLLARLMLQPANLLVLDEPTNDLDLQTLDVLMEALETFPGAVILVSHDRFFLDQVSTQLLSFIPSEKEGGEPQLIPFADYYQWEAWTDAREAERTAREKEAEEAAKRKRAAEQAAGAPAAGASGGAKKKLSFKEQREFEQMESTIHQAETRLSELAEASSASEALKSPSKLREITAEMHSLQEKIDALYARWSELSERV